ncbi:MAG: type II toxin-antitoxin system HicA family toxin [Chloroflexota bacterium]|nr:type II toxin-antitoxin system HicA family toxin [Chloroflexota bacterium]
MSLPSSDELVTALIKDGFQPRKKSSGGSHQVFRKQLSKGVKTVVVPLGKKEIPRGTLRSILRQAGLTPSEMANLIGRPLF